MSHDFARLRAELDLPPAAETDRFDAEVLAEAEAIAELPVEAPRDLTDLPFVTIDPPGSMDLDQAVHIERDGDGFRVRYAIADLGAVLPPGGPVDAEVRRRGLTIYLPDGRVPLHPPVLSEDVCSLLPDVVRRAAVWTIDVAADGTPDAATVERALVRSAARLDYETVQADADAGRLPEAIATLPDLGRVRLEHRLAAGALELGLPEQEVEADGDSWAPVWRRRTAADGWNAEISLLTGMVAARMMLDGGVGILRTLPTPRSEDVGAFLRRARSLGAEVGEEDTPGTVLARLDDTDPQHLALMNEATILLRGAGYQAFDGAAPDPDTHAGIGGAYAHVTAPLRRLVDRFGTDVCLALSAGEEVPAHVREALPQLPALMETADGRSDRAERHALDLAEAWLLEGQVGERFEAFVVRSDGREATVMLREPPVLGPSDGHGLAEGETVEVELVSVDPDEGRVAFRPV